MLVPSGVAEWVASFREEGTGTFTATSTGAAGGGSEVGLIVLEGGGDSQKIITCLSLGVAKEWTLYRHLIKILFHGEARAERDASLR